ncbi:Uncharacterised protein [Mycobacteroides abscessus subsp. abscessus]|nr:Uncharacterised protein [Mycobacteroides abscessus subsp. abscessus]
MGHGHHVLVQAHARFGAHDPIITHPPVAAGKRSCRYGTCGMICHARRGRRRRPPLKSDNSCGTGGIESGHIQLPRIPKTLTGFEPATYA